MRNTFFYIKLKWIFAHPPLSQDLSSSVNFKEPNPSHQGLMSINNAHLWQLWSWYRILHLQIFLEGLILFADILKSHTSFCYLDTGKVRFVHASLLPARDRIQGSCSVVFFRIAIPGKFAKFPERKFLECLWVTVSKSTTKFSLSNTTRLKI